MLNKIICASLIVASVSAFAGKDEKKLNVSIKDKMVEVYNEKNELVFKKKLGFKIDPDFTVVSDDQRLLFILDKKGNLGVLKKDGSSKLLKVQTEGQITSLSITGKNLIFGDVKGSVYNASYVVDKLGNIKLNAFKILADFDLDVEGAFASKSLESLVVSYKGKRTLVGPQTSSYLPGDETGSGVIGFKPDEQYPSGEKASIGFKNNTYILTDEELKSARDAFAIRYSGSELGVVSFYQLQNRLFKPIIHFPAVLDYDVTSDLSKLVVAGPESVVLFDYGKMVTDSNYLNELDKLSIHKGRIDFVKIHENKIILASADSAEIFFYDVSTGSKISSLTVDGNVRGLIIHQNSLSAISEKGGVTSFSVSDQPKIIGSVEGNKTLARNAEAKIVNGEIVVKDNRGNSLSLKSFNCNDLYLKR